MRKLDRAVCPAPACLGGYHHGKNSWGDVLAEHRAEIRSHLEVMQGKHCAYCEGNLDALGHHIEHFRSRHHHPTLTFDWSNLYWSCYQEDSCGRFKDLKAGKYQVDDLIDPCSDDPDKFFIFRSDGSISIRSDLDANERWRAKETLRVLSLDADWGRLRKMRRVAVSGYFKDAEDAFNAGFSPDEIRAYFADALEYAKHMPFYTAIRHALTER